MFRNRKVVVATLACVVALHAVAIALALTRVEEPLSVDDVAFALVFASFAAVGGLILLRQPGNRIGSIYLSMGLVFAVLGASDAYALSLPALPAREWVAWLASWTWVAGLCGVAFSLLLFPDGRLPSRRWMVVALTIVAGGGLLAIGSMLTPTFVDYPGLANPVGIAAVEGSLLDEGGIGWPFFLLGLLGAVVAMVVRFRRARGAQRQQLKWLAASALSIGAVWLLSGLFGGEGESVVATILFASALASLPVATGIAILRHRLFDIDVVISKGLVYGGLAAFIAVVYAVVVVAVPYVITGQGGPGSSGAAGGPSLPLSIAATSIVAIAFHPLRVRLQRWANRLVFGRRETPYQVLTAFSDRVAETYGVEDVLPRMARVVAEGTGAREAVVWMRLGERMSPAARWPAGTGDADRSSLVPADEALFVQEAGDAVVPIRHQGALLGALSIDKPPGEALTPAERRLLRDLASQAGMVLRNVRLTEELRARLDELSAQASELRASRQRIVEAQDTERRRLERNIHDGAQQHLVALAVKLRLARTVAARDPARARSLIGEIRAETTTALETLRDLASGIYPPMLVERGVGEALRSHRQAFAFELRVEDGGIGRYAAEVEAAVYFAVLESLQNAAKHARASRVEVTLEEQGDELAFSVTDDGVGFDPAGARHGSGLRNLADRVESVGGSLWVDAAPGRGTTVAGRVPARTMEGASR